MRENEAILIMRRARAGKPQTLHELYTCLKCLIEALKFLHTIVIMHRDIRWENILRDWVEKDTWILVDFDEGAQIPCEVAHVLDESAHAPEMHQGFHNDKVDIWSLGYLLKTSNIMLDENLVVFRKQCLLPNAAERPTAYECGLMLEAYAYAG